MTLEVETGSAAPTVEENQTVNEPQVTPPKKRGRPPGSGKKQGEGETAQNVPGDSKPAGAKRGPKPRGGKKLGPDDVAGLAKQIQGLHLMGAMVTGIPEMQVGDKEAELLASAVVAVASQYDLSIDGKTGALIQLAAACATVYLPRFLAVKVRVQTQRQAQGVTIDHETGQPTAA